MVRIFRFPYQKPFIPAFHPLFSRVVLSKEELRKGPGDPGAAGEPQPSGTASCLGFGNAKRVTGNHFSFVSTKKWHKKKKWKKKRNWVFPVVTFLCLNFFTFWDKKEGKKRKKKLVTSHNQEQLFPGSRKKGKQDKPKTSKLRRRQPKTWSWNETFQETYPLSVHIAKQFLSQHHILSRKKPKLFITLIIYF